MANSFDGIGGFVTESTAGGLWYDLRGGFLTEQAAAAGGGVVWHLAGDRSNATLGAPTTHRLKDI